MDLINPLVWQWLKFLGIAFLITWSLMVLFGIGVWLIGGGRQKKLTNGILLNLTFPPGEG